MDEDVFRKALKTAPKGSGAAVGGARFEHWVPVLSSPGAFGALHKVCQRLSDAAVPESAAAALALAKVTPLLKPNGGVRPIAAPAILRRLVGKCMVRERKEQLADALAIQ